MSISLERLIFYRDINDSIFLDPNITDRFYLIFDKDEKLKFNFKYRPEHIT